MITDITETTAAATVTAERPAPDDALTTEELADLVAQRKETYGLLARLYRKEADAELLDQLHGMLYPYHTRNEHVDKGNLLIATYLSNLTPNSVDELSIDYTRTFIGGGNNAFSAAYPFESVYTGEKRLKMQAARDQVLAIYRSEGLDKADGWHEFEDHIACELEFMGVMAERMAEAIRAEKRRETRRLLRVQENFMRDHLASWVGHFAHDVRRFSQTKLYQGLAHLTMGFLKTDWEFLKDPENEL